VRSCAELRASVLRSLSKVSLKSVARCGSLLTHFLFPFFLLGAPRLFMSPSPRDFMTSAALAKSTLSRKEVSYAEVSGAMMYRSVSIRTYARRRREISETHASCRWIARPHLLGPAEFKQLRIPQMCLMDVNLGLIPRGRHCVVFDRQESGRWRDWIHREEGPFSANAQQLYMTCNRPVCRPSKKFKSSRGICRPFEDRIASPRALANRQATV